MAVLDDFYRNLAPDMPLPYGDERYVDCGEVRGTRTLLSKMVRDIRNAQSSKSQTLLSGHRGCGKTTELYRIQHALMKEGSKRFWTAMVNADDYLALNDVQAPEVLLGVVTGLWDELGKHTDLQLERTSVFETFRSWLSSLTVSSDVELSGAFAKLKLSLKGDASKRQELRDKIAERSNNFRHEVNELIGRIRTDLQDRYAGVVVIFDNLDRMTYKSLSASEERTNQDALFVDYWDTLEAPDCHLVYTIPPAVYYTPGVGNRDRFMIPMIPVAGRDGAASEAGYAVLRKMLEKRAKQPLATLFDSEESIRRLCYLSGGYERQLLRLCRSAIHSTADGPVVTRAAVEEAMREERDDMVYGLNTAGWERLLQVAPATPPSDVPRVLLESHRVLQYRDIDGPWVAPNPILKECPEYRK